MKIKDGQIFQTTGETWSVWIPEGMTIKVFISPDGNENHFAEIGEQSIISGPNVFQCMGYNPRSFFKLTGIGEGKTAHLDVLV